MIMLLGGNRMAKVFIDGQEGTTGLNIARRLAGRNDIHLIPIEDALRKDAQERRRMMQEADVVILCLPDGAAKDAVHLAEGLPVRILDASTAHRTQSGWAYGFPELSKEHREAVQKGSKVSVPGCHASGFAALVYPLVKAGVLPTDYPIVCHSVTGYSGGGKKMIAEYEAPERSNSLKSPRQYALSQTHKHLAEMQKVCGLAFTPIFNPIVADFYGGMAVSIPLYTRLLNKKITRSVLHEVYSAHYQGEKLVRVLPLEAGEEMGGFLAANTLNGKDYMEIVICGNDDRLLLVARFDNLGKGASGAAVQCLNLMTGAEEYSGLNCWEDEEYGMG
jgi:N-acetyl-gamma-glutamyl-phosphate reductase